MHWPSQQRWKALWQTAGVLAAPAGWYERLTQAHAEPHRYYHNQQHVAECLAELDQTRYLADNPTVVELAIWFHDAVYDPKAADNEEQSAALASRCLVEIGADKPFLEAVTKLVLATKTHLAHGDADAELMIDVDLSILGREPARFFEYEDQIRQEYAWVPPSVFAEKRGEILRRFLARERVFMTDWFHEKYERQARLNLAESVHRLSPA